MTSNDAPPPTPTLLNNSLSDRDTFALAVMLGMLRRDDAAEVVKSNALGSVAELSYMIADALLDARARSLALAAPRASP